MCMFGSGIVPFLKSIANLLPSDQLKHRWEINLVQQTKEDEDTKM